MSVDSAGLIDEAVAESSRHYPVIDYVFVLCHCGDRSDTASEFRAHRDQEVRRVIETAVAAAAAQAEHGDIDQLAALRATVALAEAKGLPARPGSALGLDHLQFMLATAEEGDFSPAKLGRWLGWAQAVLVNADLGTSMANMRALNSQMTARGLVALPGCYRAGEPNTNTPTSPQEQP